MIVSISNEVILIIAYYGSMTKILQLNNIERIEGDNGTAVTLDRHSHGNGNLLLFVLLCFQLVKRYPVISGVLPFTLRAALRAFKFTPDKFVRGYDVNFFLEFHVH